MMDIPAELDAWADDCAVATGLPTTRDPATITAPGIFLDLPDPVARRTLTALAVTLPVWLLTDLPGQAGADQLLTGLPVLLGYAQEGVTASPGTITLGGTVYRGYVMQVPLIITPDPITP